MKRFFYSVKSKTAFSFQLVSFLLPSCILPHFTTACNTACFHALFVSQQSRGANYSTVIFLCQAWKLFFTATFPHFRHRINGTARVFLTPFLLPRINEGANYSTGFLECNFRLLCRLSQHCIAAPPVGIEFPH